ncbi:MAG: 50S ribosomal protein L24 [Candidatus Staskawiczbacteria bacterium RIFCSPHIGHO2_02_FULL_34_9]|uniref:Large ribosomal subunit protein uL24 n=1 Tax=Candidatus Staskawiczbacteria bacterium RIFCSPHIGHO2_02_FULL_34_9 TaxID=1802206 RepID=A0A1G2HZ39_9BACT|nr:MAG: 50S ribosomal protein L24 [Candidatus Staskawiczbacteria bacterium RIFCSPHIGHO2_02_FULL_34_9]
MKIKKGDNVLVISGKDKGKTGKVLRSIPKEARILVEGANLKQKHLKPKKQGEKGQVVKSPASLDVSNVKILCPKCQKPARIGYKITNGKKVRICKKCKSEI